MSEKKKIIENLIREGHIGLDEALILLETEKEFVTVPYIEPYIPYQPYQPYQPFWFNTRNPYTGGVSGVISYTVN